MATNRRRLKRVRLLKSENATLTKLTRRRSYDPRIIHFTELVKRRLQRKSKRVRENLSLRVTQLEQEVGSS